MPRSKWVAIVCLVLAAGAGLRAAGQAAASDQHSDLGNDPRGVDASGYGDRVKLGPYWLFMPGDDPKYAAPTLDDGKWTTILVEKPLQYYGYRDLAHAWYRIHVKHLPAGAHDLALGVREVSGSYEVYANGVRIGGEGPISGMVQRMQTRLEAFAIPDGLIAPNGELVVAFRFALNAAGTRGRGTSSPMDEDTGIYLMSRASVAHESGYVTAHKVAVNFALLALGVLVGIVAIALFGAMRNQKEYLAAAVFLFATSGVSMVLIHENRWAYTISANLVQLFLGGTASVALIEFVRLVLAKPRPAALLALEIVSFVGWFGGPLATAGIVPVYFAFALVFLPALIVDVLLPVMLFLGWRRGNIEARRLLPALLIYSFHDYWNFGRYLAYFAHLTPRLIDMPELDLRGYKLSLTNFGVYVSFLAILVFLVRRTVRIARSNARAAAEMEAARTVQQLLVGVDLPEVPGFVMKSVYRPAGEVGGDFFQIVALKNGAVLVVIGDVSGKGMPAALTVSLLVGTVRTLAHYTESPGEILAAMNERVLARSGGGFTTCLAIRAEKDGKVTMANAGHLAPYVDGREMEIENGFPLGIVAGATYRETTVELGHAQQLTLVTDGVVEARDKRGVLFGFERTAELSNKTAERIVEAAQAFGQNDDITALTLARTG